MTSVYYNVTSQALITSAVATTEFPDYLPTTGTCTEGWNESQNPVFHVAMLLFAAASAVHYTYKYYVVVVRLFILASLVFLLLWGAIFWCTWDVVMWAAIYFLQNLAQLVYALYQMRHVKFAADLEDVFLQLFKPFNISRQEFKSLVNQYCKYVTISPGDKYAIEGHTTTDARISILISGNMNVTYKGMLLHHIGERQMIDSAEWESTKVRRGEIFQVTIEADDPCSYLCWNREKLQYYLQANPKIELAFTYIRGKDVMEKVYQTTINALRRAKLTEKPDCCVSATGIRNGLAVEDPEACYNMEQ